MINKNKIAKVIKRIPWLTVGVVCLFLLLVWVIASANRNNFQAIRPTRANIYFEGEYSIDGGEWTKITEGKHIPATKGDVTLRGRFHMSAPDGQYIGPVKQGTPIAFFLDHINVVVYESGMRPYELFNENPAVGKSGCGEIWLTYIQQATSEEPIEIVIRNPHSFGNETAVDSFLEGIDFWSGNDFESDVLASGNNQRGLGLLFCIGAVVLFGIALFSTLIHIKENRLIWLLGLVTFFAGIYFLYSAPGAYFWRELISVNTSVINASMMYYMLFVLSIIAFFSRETQRLGKTVTIVLGAVDAAIIILPLVTPIYFYDMLPVWTIAQTLINLIMIGCLIKEIVFAGWKRRTICSGLIVLLVGFEVDVAATAAGWWKGGAVSMYVFIVLFLSALVIVLYTIPQKILELKKAQELELQKSRLEIEKNAIEAELKENRISIMLSQIRPHFIYNTLGTIERLCLKNPQMAFELVRNFSLYLRGNFRELDSVAPIRFSDEMEHVRYYVNIERVRFPDMTIEYQLEVSDFFIPAISVQPLVENAIKHGLMPLETGGKVVIRSYKTDTHYCVEVVDNGAGFDTSIELDKKEHVGLNNIRERLRAIVGGDLVVESEIGVGTKAIILIPREEIA